MLSDGKLVEAGHPHELLSSAAEDRGVAHGSSYDVSFASMVEETGPETAVLLRGLALDAWEASRGRGDTGTAS